MSLFGILKDNTDVSTDSMSPSDINALLYKRNTELATKNKVLSLIGHLYEISILTLKPDKLAKNISSSIRDALNYESAAIFLYNKEKDYMSQAGVARSERFQEQLRLSGINLNNDVKIRDVSKSDFFDSIVVKHAPILNKQFGFLLKNGLLSDNEIKMLADRAHLKSSIIYPLTLGDRVLGMLIITMKRDYETLPDYEKEIIGSITNVVSLSLDKSLTYEELQTANDELKSLDVLKTEFISLASHQLRSPLTAIKGYTSMLLEGSFGEINDKQKESIERVYQSSNHLTKVVEDLLNVSKIEAGGMRYEMSQFDIEKVINLLIIDLSDAAKKKNLTITFTKDNKSPYTMNGDVEKIRQIILNIVDNAIRYTQQGGIVINLAKNEQAGAVKITVTDTGMGISQEEKDRLFQKFSRGEGGKTNTSGSGLGLYLSKQIAEAHDGHISIDSPGQGRGSTFIIDLKV